MRPESCVVQTTRRVVEEVVLSLKKLGHQTKADSNEPASDLYNSRGQFPPTSCGCRVVTKRRPVVCRRADQ